MVFDVMNDWMGDFRVANYATRPASAECDTYKLGFLFEI